MSAPSTSGLSVELLLRVIDVKYGYFTLLYFISNNKVHVRLALFIFASKGIKQLFFL